MVKNVGSKPRQIVRQKRLPYIPVYPDTNNLCFQQYNHSYFWPDLCLLDLVKGDLEPRIQLNSKITTFGPQAQFSSNAHL
jgi:hypothetical protein